MTSLRSVYPLRVFRATEAKPTSDLRPLTSDFHPHRGAVTRVLFRDTGEPVGTIHRDETGTLVASCERLRWIAETAIDIHLRRIQPHEEDFLDWLPNAYSGSLFRCEEVAWAGEDERG